VEEIIIKIDKKGKSTVTVNGVKGGSCADLTKRLESSLGEIVSDKKTSEFYQEGESCEVRITN